MIVQRKTSWNETTEKRKENLNESSWILAINHAGSWHCHAFFDHSTREIVRSLPTCVVQMRHVDQGIARKEIGVEINRRTRS